MGQRGRDQQGWGWGRCPTSGWERRLAGRLTAPGGAASHVLYAADGLVTGSLTRVEPLAGLDEPRPVGEHDRLDAVAQP